MIYKLLASLFFSIFIFLEPRKYKQNFLEDLDPLKLSVLN